MTFPLKVSTGLAAVMSQVRDISTDLLWAVLPKIAQGGSTWTLQRPSAGGGGGVTGPASSEPNVTITEVWVVRAGDMALTATSAGTTVGDDEWTIHAKTTKNLRVGDRLTSQTTPSFKVRIDTLQKTEAGEYWEGTVEVLR